VGVKLGICVPVGGFEVFVGEIKVLFAEHDTTITVPRNNKHIDFFIGNLSFCI
jgi:hypothetical protein